LGSVCAEAEQERKILGNGWIERSGKSMKGKTSGKNEMGKPIWGSDRKDQRREEVRTKAPTDMGWVIPKKRWDNETEDLLAEERKVDDQESTGTESGPVKSNLISSETKKEKEKWPSHSKCQKSIFH
jgi:hypothetical protein